MTPFIFTDYQMGAAGASCYLCNIPKVDGVRVVATGVEVDMEGILHICETCIVQMAVMLGCTTPAQSAENHALAKSLADKIEALVEQIATWQTKEEAVDDIIRRANSPKQAVKARG